MFFTIDNDNTVYVLLVLFLVIYLYENMKYSQNKRDNDKTIKYLREEILMLKSEVRELKMIGNKNYEKMKLQNLEHVDVNNKLENINKKLFELNNDVSLKYQLFVNSMKLLKSDVEEILVKHDSYIQYVYYYLASFNSIEKFNSKFFRYVIVKERMFNYFDLIKESEIDEQAFFTENFKKFMEKKRVHRI